MSARRSASPLNRRIPQIAALLLLAVMRSPAQPAVTFTTYPLPVYGTAPSITAGPDGALWIADYDRILRMTTTGALTSYLVPFGQLNKISAFDITVGPDGALWFTATDIAKIGRITTDGVFDAYTLPGGDRGPQRIVAGPDGALWFTETTSGQQGKIGRITTTGTITEYELSASPRHPAGIAPGPDGALWFTDFGDGRIHRITTAGTVTDYGLAGTGNLPGNITVGPDGALWFAAADTGGPNDRIGRITTSGAMTTYLLPIYDRPTYNGYNNLAPYSIATGPDGAIWFTSSRVNVLGRVTAGGQVALYHLPPLAMTDEVWELRGVALGPDGALWITSNGMVIRAAIALEPDTSLPAISPLISGALGTNGWYRSNVMVNWAVSDPQFGIVGSSGCNQSTLSGDTASITLTCSATNGAGVSKSVPVTIKIDSSPPVILGMPAPGCTLWPPNHKMIQMAVVSASDTLAGLAPGLFRVNVTSSEPSGSGDPDIIVAPDGSGGFIVQLRAERLDGADRVYTLNARAIDKAGNSATATAICTVPHDAAH